MARKPNTDNIGHLFVTVFANRSCSLDSFVKPDKSGPRTCFQLNLVYLDLLHARQ